MDVPLPHDLLSSNHVFPGIYQIKAIGESQNDFETRVLEAVRAEIEEESPIEVSVKTTPGGRHISLTLDVTVQTPAQVIAIYGRIQAIDGLRFLL
jgi:uncharacterized protein